MFDYVNTGWVYLMEGLLTGSRWNLAQRWLDKTANFRHHVSFHGMSAVIYRQFRPYPV